MRELTRNVWDGTDYVPYVWDAWLTNASGWLMVGVLDGRTVALQHVERQADGTAWVEGIRVAADVRDRGIGRAMLDRAVAWAREHRCPWLRLATSSENPASNRIAERAGLRLLGSFVSVDAAPDTAAREGLGVRVAAPTEFDSIQQLLDSTAGSDPPPLVYTEGWTAYTLTPERLRLLLSVGNVVVSGVGQDSLAIATSVVARPSLRIGLLRGERKGMERICRWLTVRAGESGLTIVRANVECQRDAVSALEGAGFRSRHGHCLCLRGIDLADSTSVE
jgi:GNAT superfamily N-acetyltransferase